MSLNINVGGTWKAPTPWINVGGTWKKPKAIFANVAGVWKQVWTGLTVALNRTSAAYSGKSYYYSWTGTTVTVTGNTGTPTYNWVISSDGQANWKISSGQGTDTVTVYMSGITAGDFSIASLYCNVTVDGQTVASPVCNFSYTNTQIV